MIPENAKKIISTAEGKMKDATAYLEENLRSYRVGKANPAIFNNVHVDYYGTPTPLAQVASVTTPDARTLAIQPWEKSMISKIEKAIIDASLGFTPSNNGEVIRCVVPALTEERRKELIKKAKIVIRNARRDAVDALKKAQKNDGLPEDSEKEAEDEVQKLTDKMVKNIDTIIAGKEKEIMTV